MTKRWPLHPRPRPAEALSSWLKRIANAHDLTIKDLLVHDLGLRNLPSWELDHLPPDAIFGLLSARTGIAVARIRQMSCCAFLGETCTGDTAEAAFESYVRTHSVLLSPGVRQAKKVKPDWSAWFCQDRFLWPWGCPACMSEPNGDYLRLHWRLPLTATCPTHRMFLEPLCEMGTIKLQPVGKLKPAPRVVPEAILALDAISQGAFMTGDAMLPSVRLSCRTWLQLLRTILDELNTTGVYAGNQHGLLARIWRTADLRIRAGVTATRPFEDMKPNQRSEFLEAAATAIVLLTNRGDLAYGHDLAALGARQAPPPKTQAAFATNR
jgi:TniQ